MPNIERMQSQPPKDVSKLEGSKEATRCLARDLQNVVPLTIRDESAGGLDQEMEVFYSKNPFSW